MNRCVIVRHKTRRGGSCQRRIDGNDLSDLLARLCSQRLAASAWMDDARVGEVVKDDYQGWVWRYDPDVEEQSK